MALRHVFDDCQTQAGATGFPRATAVHAVKTLGQTRQMFWRNTRPAVLHREHQRTFCRLLQADRNAATRWGIAHRVADQIAHGAEQLADVTDQSALILASKRHVMQRRTATNQR